MTNESHFLFFALRKLAFTYEKENSFSGGYVSWVAIYVYISLLLYSFAVGL